MKNSVVVKSFADQINKIIDRDRGRAGIKLYLDISFRCFQYCDIIRLFIYLHHRALVGSNFFRDFVV